MGFRLGTHAKTTAASRRLFSLVLPAHNACKWCFVLLVLLVSLIIVRLGTNGGNRLVALLKTLVLSFIIVHDLLTCSHVFEDEVLQVNLLGLDFPAISLFVPYKIIKLGHVNHLSNGYKTCEFHVLAHLLRYVSENLLSEDVVANALIEANELNIVSSSSIALLVLKKEFR